MTLVNVLLYVNLQFSGCTIINLMHAELLVKLLYDLILYDDDSDVAKRKGKKKERKKEEEAKIKKKKKRIL